MVQALNRIAYCFGRDVAPRYDLPDLMIKEDAGELWGRVFELVRIMAPGSTARIEQLTQGVRVRAVPEKTSDHELIRASSD